METLDGDTGGIGRFDAKVIEAECGPKDIQRRRIGIRLEPYVNYINPFKKPKKRTGIFTMLFESACIRKRVITYSL
jgi:hypothetical protein